jgi:hypothetical protein
MAQSGYTPILIYASGTATNVPLAANLTSSASGAELALNYADGKLYYKDSGGVVQILASKAGNVNVSSFSAGTTGLTPNTATTGAVTLAGTLVVGNGGTGLTSLTAGYIPFGNGTSAFGSSANLTWDGTTFGVVGRLYNGSASTFGASTWGMSLGNGGSSANYFKAATTYWQDNAGTQIMQLGGGSLAVIGAISATAATADTQTTLTLAEPGTRSLVLKNPTSTLDGEVATGTNHPLTIAATTSVTVKIGSFGSRSSVGTFASTGLSIGTTSANGKLTTYNGTVGASATTLTPNATLWMDYAGGTGNNAGSGSSLVFANGTTPGATIKSAAIGAPSEDTGGLSRTIGLSFWTSDFDANRSEKVRITGAGNLVVGSTASLSAQANRTDLTVNGTSTAIVSLGVGNVRQGYLYTPNSGIILTSETNNLNLQTSGAYPITFNTNSAEAGRFTSAGNFLVGSTTQAGRFYSYTSSNQWAMYGENALSSGSTAGVLALVASQNSTNNSFKAIVYYNSGAGQDRFSVSDSGAIATAGSIALGTNGAPPTSGIGVQFPAAQVSSSNANTLDDYEEGTWTPTIITSDGNQSITYNTQTGRYIKIGRLVKLSWYINTTTIVSQGTGTLRIGGLPGFAPDTGEESPGSFWSVASLVGGTLKNFEVGCRANSGSELLLLNNTSTGLLATGSMTGGGYAIGQLVYITTA